MSIEKENLLKTVVKDYGTLLAPILTFLLGVLALYIKFKIDRWGEVRKSRRKLRKLIEIIKDSRPPLKFYPNISEEGLHPDQIRNWNNFLIFVSRFEVIMAYIDTVENDILTDCSVIEVQQFHLLKLVSTYLKRKLEDIREENIKENEDDEEFYRENIFNSILFDYNRLISVCNNPRKDFSYKEN